MSGCLHTLLVRREQLDFPSPYLIPRVLKHMEQGMEMGTLVIPLWTSAPWWPLITTDGTKPIGSKFHLMRICSSHTKCLSLKWNTMLLGSCSLVSKLLRITWLGSTNVSHAQTQSFKRTMCYSLLWARSHVFEGLMCCGMRCSLHKGRSVWA